MKATTIKAILKVATPRVRQALIEKRDAVMQHRKHLLETKYQKQLADIREKEAELNKKVKEIYEKVDKETGFRGDRYLIHDEVEKILDKAELTLLLQDEKHFAVNAFIDNLLKEIK